MDNIKILAELYAAVYHTERSGPDGRPPGPAVARAIAREAVVDFVQLVSTKKPE